VLGGGSAIAGGTALAGLATTGLGIGEAIKGPKQTPPPQFIYGNPNVPMGPLQNAFLYGNPGGPNSPSIGQPPGAGAYRGGGGLAGLTALSNLNKGGISPGGGGIVGGGIQGLNTLQGIAQGTAGPQFQNVWSAIQAAQQRYISEGQANLTEQFGAMGLRYSTPLANALIDYKSQVAAQGTELLGKLGMQQEELSMSAGSTLAGLLAQASGAFYQPGYAPSSAASLISGGAGLLSASRLMSMGGDSGTPSVIPPGSSPMPNPTGFNPLTGNVMPIWQYPAALPIPTNPYLSAPPAYGGV